MLIIIPHLCGMQSQGKYSEAEKLVQHALSVCEQRNTRFHPSTAACLHTLGTLQWRQKKLKDAESSLKEALAVRGLKV